MKINKIKTKALQKLKTELEQTHKNSAYFQHIIEELKRRATK